MPVRHDMWFMAIAQVPVGIHTMWCHVRHARGQTALESPIGIRKPHAFRRPGSATCAMWTAARKATSAATARSGIAIPETCSGVGDVCPSVTTCCRILSLRAEPPVPEYRATKPLGVGVLGMSDPGSDLGVDHGTCDRASMPAVAQGTQSIAKTGDVVLRQATTSTG
jgi:hypothetical protein